MPFPMSFNAYTVKPIIEFTDEQMEYLDKHGVRPRCGVVPTREQIVASMNLRRHQFFAKAAGATGDDMDVATAKKYVRARSASLLKNVFETFEHVLLSPNSKPADKMLVAEEMMKRAVGPATVQNGIANVKGLTEMAPVDAIDAVLTAFAKGECDETFVKTLLGLLGAKVNGLKIEQELAKKSAQKMGDKLNKPPSGKVV